MGALANGRSEDLVGARVRVHAASYVLRLEADTGQIIWPDTLWDGYYIVRLDQPASYDNGVSAAPRLSEIRVAIDNLEPLEPRPDWPAAPRSFEEGEPAERPVE